MKSKQKYGLIGSPIAHSLSPALFKAGFNGLYSYDLIEGEDFEQSFKCFLEGYDAVNITAPFKELAYSKADIPSQECEAIGACNILIKRPDAICAENTDITAIIKCLLPYQTAGSLAPSALVVGCGGAGKAAAYAACQLGYQVIILNRTLSKAEEFAAHLSKIDNRNNVSARPLDEFCKWFRKAGIIIYTAPKQINQIDNLKSSDIRGGIIGHSPKIILEANYKDPTFTESRLKTLMEKNPKIYYINGKEWLLEQAVEAFYLFTRSEPNIQEMIKVL